MVDVASLGLAINSQPVTEATRALDNLARSAAPATAAVKQLEQAAQPAVAAIQRLEQVANNGLKRGLDNVAQSGRQSAQVIAMNSGQMRQLSFQLNDAATMLASGSSPFQVLATQGGQVFQALQGPQGVVGSLKQIGLSLMGLAGPAKIAGGVLAGVGVTAAVAWNLWDDRIKAMQIALNGLGRTSGLTSANLMQMAERAASVGNMSIATAASGVTQFAGAGIGAGNIAALSGITRRYSGALGMSVGDAQGQLAQAFGDPTRGLEIFAKTLGPFGYEIDLNVRRLQAQNRMEEARTALFKALEDRIRGMTDATGTLTKAMDGAKGLFSELGRLAAKAVAAPTLEERLAAAKARLEEASRPRDFWSLSTISGASSPAMPWQRGLNNRGRAQQEVDFLQEAIAESFRGPAVEAAKAAGASNSYLAAELKKLRDAADLGAAGIIARTAGEKLSVEMERIKKEAADDANRAKTKEIDLYRAQVTAMADAARAFEDFNRRIKDESYLAGATSPADRIRRQIDIELRQLRESQIGGPPNDQWYNKFENRAGNLWNPSPSSPFAFPNNVPMPAFVGNVNMGPLSRMMGELGLLSSSPVSGGSGAGSRAGGGPIDYEALRKKMFETRSGELWEPMLRDFGRSITANEEILRVQIATFGKSTFEITRATEAQRLENEIKRQGLDVTDRMREKIAELAEKQAEYTAKAERFAELQRGIIENLDFTRSSASDLIGGPIKAFARGENPGKAFQQASGRMLDRFIDMQVNNLVSSVLGPMGKPGGGAIGGFLAQFLGAKQNTAQMNVQAGIVNVGGAGAIPGATGGSGGIGGWFSSLFPGSGGTASSGWDYTPSMDLANSWSFANGGIMTSRGAIPLRTYAKGGVANTPQMAIYGEGSGPEAYVPLPDGRSIPVSIRQKEAAIAGSSRGDSGTDVRVYDHSGQKIETRKGRGPNGRQYLDIIISEVGSAIASGQMDTAFRGRYGAQPVSVRR